MNTALITQTRSSVNRKHTVPPPEGKICTAQGSTANKYPAPDESKRVLHTVPCKTGLSVPAIKTDKVCSRQPEPIRTSNPRGYNTGNVPPSYGPEDGNLYDQETIEISTDEVK